MNAVPGAGWSKGVFQMHRRKTLAVPMQIHQISREKVCSIMRNRGIDGVLLVQGGSDQNQYDTDTEHLFRQDSWFNYLFGTKEPGMFGTINVATGRSVLFVPKLPEWWSIWCGTVYPPSYFKELYGVDEVLYVEDLAEWLRTSASTIHLIDGVNSDSGLSPAAITFDGKEEFQSRFSTEHFYHALSTARVTKSPVEIMLMSWCALAASNAHVNVMRATRAGLAEYELEAIFLYHIYRDGGCRRCAYTSICACGPNGAVLHYGHAGAPNDRELESTDMALLDMGAEYHGYVSDITCSFPVSGRFTADQRAIYEGVLAAQRAVLDSMRPGFPWPECHKLAERAILEALVKVGILVDGTIDELVDALMGPVFFPHGLGHLIGCDTHDVGGYIADTPARSERLGLAKLRTARILEPGMTLTNEPGCYFIHALLDKALANPEQAKYINTDVLARFRNFGGVRLEDVVVVTDNGVSNLTTCPRTVEEIENVIAGGAWPPAVDAAPYLRRRWVQLSPDCQSLVELPRPSGAP